jgi:hypothetical protein
MEIDWLIGIRRENIEYTIIGYFVFWKECLPKKVWEGKEVRKVYRKQRHYGGRYEMMG